MSCSNPIQTFNPANAILYWFGDSIPAPQSPPSYAGLIADPVLFPQWAGHQSINAAAGGHVFSQQEAIYAATWDAQLALEAASGKTVIVTYAIGGNDMNSKPSETLFSELAAHSAMLHGKGIKTACTTVLPRTYAEGAQGIQRFNELLIRSCGVFDWVLDFSSQAEDPLDPLLYPDGVHPSPALHHQLAGMWDVGVRLGLRPEPRTRVLRSISNTDIGLIISGKSGGQTAHLQDWSIGPNGPASYVDGLGHIFGRTINAISGGINVAGGGTFGPLSSMPQHGTGIFMDNNSAKMVFKTSASEQWSILNTGDLVPLAVNDVGSTTNPVKNLYAETVLAGGVNVGQVIADLQARITALEQEQ